MRLFTLGRVAHQLLSVVAAKTDELTGIALALRERVEMGPRQLFRLVGVGLSNFQVAEDAASPLVVETPAEIATGFEKN